MELWLTLVALYAWQCLVWLHVPSAAFGPRWLGCGDLHRRGVQVLSPWPSTLGAVASRLPFALIDGGQRVALRTGDILTTQAPLALDGLALECRGVRLLANGRTTLKAPSKSAARVWHFALASLAEAPHAERAHTLSDMLARSLDADALRERLDAARRTTRWLAWLCDAYLTILLLVLPLVGVVFGIEYTLAASLPTLGTLHALALALAYVAHRRLFPDRRGERFEELFMAALYPPTLLRRPQAWVDAAGAGFHPLAWVRALVDDDEARRVWLRERARLARELVRRPDASEVPRAELAALDAQTPAAWSSTPLRNRSDPLAESYCPVCWDDFRVGFDRCAGCDAETVRYAASPTGA